MTLELDEDDHWPLQTFEPIDRLEENRLGVGVLFLGALKRAIV